MSDITLTLQKEGVKLDTVQGKKKVSDLTVIDQVQNIYNQLLEELPELPEDDHPPLSCYGGWWRLKVP